MLMEEIKQEHGQEQINKSDDTIIYIRNDPVMQSAIDLLPILGSKNKVILRAVGNSIPNAVAVANIIQKRCFMEIQKLKK